MRNLALLLILTACSEGHLSDPDSTGPIMDGVDSEAPTLPTDPTCSAEVAWVQPEPGSIDVRVDQEFAIGLSEPLSPNAPWSVEVDGASGVAHLSTDRRIITWFPDVPLDYSAPYTLAVSLCDTYRRIDFSTRGKPIDPEDLLGGHWNMRPNEATWLEPSVASVFVPAVEFGALTFFVDRGSRNQWRLFAYVDIPLEYSGECGESIDMGTLDLTDNPSFSTAPTSIDISIDDRTLAVAHTQITGTFATDGSYVQDLTVRGRVDVRPIEDLAEGSIDLCDMARLAGDSCAPCPDGIEACLFTVLTMDTVDTDSAGRHSQDQCDR